MKNGKISHIEMMKAQYNNNRLAVLWFTGLTDAQYKQFQFDTGLAWLIAYTADNEDILRWILSQPLIWRWWVNEWNRRDDVFVDLLFTVQNDECAEYYKCLHYELVGEYTPMWGLIERDYAKAIGELNKNLKISI